MSTTHQQRYRALLEERLLVASGVMAAMGRTTARDRAVVREIREALRRVEAGSYGVCCGCGGPVGERRLHLRPAARRCLPCERGLVDKKVSVRG